MRVIAFLFWFTVCITTTSAQPIVNGQITDLETKKPIPFVNIGIIKSELGTVSDEKGRFKLKFTDKMDKVTISSIGYQTKEIFVSDLLINGNITLESKQYQIQTVELKSKTFSEQEILLGEKNKKRGASFGFGSTQLGTEFGALIKIDKETYIKSVNFVLNHAKGDSMHFRVNIYPYSPDSIGENLLRENVIIAQKQKKGLLTVDLSSYGLIIDKDVLLSLEWIKDDKGEGNKGMTFDTKKSRRSNGIFLKMTSNAAFKKLADLYPRARKYQPCFYFIGKQVE